MNRAARRRLHLYIAELTADTDPAAALAPDDEHTITEVIRLYQQLRSADPARTLARRTPR